MRNDDDLIAGNRAAPFSFETDDNDEPRRLAFSYRKFLFAPNVLFYGG